MFSLILSIGLPHTEKVLNNQPYLYIYHSSMACSHIFYFHANCVVDLLHPPPCFLQYICSAAICVETKQFLLHLLINTMREGTACSSRASALATVHSIAGKEQRPSGEEECPSSPEKLQQASSAFNSISCEPPLSLEAFGSCNKERKT